MTATTRGGRPRPCHDAACRTRCTHALASLPVAHAKGSVLSSLKRGEALLLLLLRLLRRLASDVLALLALLAPNQPGPSGA
jgi:hypothetical protein